DRIEAQSVQTRLDVRQRQRPGNIRLQFVGDIRRQVLRAPQSVPRHEGETRHAGLLYRRNVGGRRGALEAGDAECLDLAALRQRQRGQHRVGEELNLAAHEVGERRCRALVRDHQGVEARVELEQLDGEVAGGADGRRTEGEFLRIFAHEGKEILEIVRRYARGCADD